MKDAISDPLFGNICSLIEQARQQVHRINSVMVQTYWEIGQLIVEDEQQGKARAAYGKQQLEQLSSQLTEVFGKGFDSITQNWSARALERQISVLYYDVRIYDQHKKAADDNPTIGLILCSQKSEAVAKYSVLTDSEQLFAAKYMNYLPSEEELKRELEREHAYVEYKIEEAKAEYRVD
jgi:DUF1016 N-terminal domain/YhcG PDDEXK nuclease domain